MSAVLLVVLLTSSADPALELAPREDPEDLSDDSSLARRVEGPLMSHLTGISGGGAPDAATAILLSGGVMMGALDLLGITVTGAQYAACTCTYGILSPLMCCGFLLEPFILGAFPAAAVSLVAIWTMGRLMHRRPPWWMAAAAFGIPLMTTSFMVLGMLTLGMMAGSYWLGLAPESPYSATPGGLIAGFIVMGVLGLFVFKGLMTAALVLSHPLALLALTLLMLTTTLSADERDPVEHFITRFVGHPEGP